MRKADIKIGATVFVLDGRRVLAAVAKAHTEGGYSPMVQTSRGTYYTTGIFPTRLAAEIAVATDGTKRERYENARRQGKVESAARALAIAKVAAKKSADRLAKAEARLAALKARVGK